MNADAIKLAATLILDASAWDDLKDDEYSFYTDDKETQNAVVAMLIKEGHYPVDRWAWDVGIDAKFAKTILKDSEIIKGFSETLFGQVDVELHEKLWDEVPQMLNDYLASQQVDRDIDDHKEAAA